MIARRLWHLVGGLVFPVLAFFVPLVPLLIIIGVAMAILIGLENIRFAFPRINKWAIGHLSPILKKEERTSRLTGTTWSLIATLLVFLAFDKHIAIAGLLFLAVGDSSAGVIGQRFGKRKVWGKSVEGSLAFLASCLPLSLLLTWAPVDLSLPVLVIGTVAAAACEFMPMPLDDNFSVPLVSAGAMTLARLLL